MCCRMHWAVMRGGRVSLHHHFPCDSSWSQLGGSLFASH